MSVINSGSLKKLTEIAIVFTQDFGKPRLAIAPECICGSVHVDMEDFVTRLGKDDGSETEEF
jgi:hypothetical protein